MRQLTKKQKKLLNKWYEEFEKTNPLWRFEDLNAEQQETLKKINDTEILHLNVNRFLADLYFKKLNKR